MQAATSVPEIQTERYICSRGECLTRRWICCCQECGERRACRDKGELCIYFRDDCQYKQEED